MILRDPVHGLVAFDGERERVITALLATDEVQRLRRIRQLGLASLVYPGAEHTRFAHAVGAAHVMGRLLDRIRALRVDVRAGDRIDLDAERDAIAASLLHDLGHGPMSHLFEEVMPNATHHEAWTAACIADPSTTVHRALAGIDPGLPTRVGDLLRGTHRVSWLPASISGRLDVDRADYLLRDSHMTGVRYGVFDLDWLLRSLTLAPHRDDPKRTVLAVEGRKGLPAIESFFLARHFMYTQVYHHKATRAAECLIRAIFRRVAMLARDGFVFTAETPAALVAAARGEKPALNAYLELDDARLMTALESWAKSNDASLANLAARFLRRDLPKSIPLPENDPERKRLAYARVADLVRARGLDPDEHVWLDLARDTPYEESPDAEGVWVALRHRPLAPLGDISFVLRQLRNVPIERPRLIVEPSLRDEAARTIQDLLE